MYYLLIYLHSISHSTVCFLYMFLRLLIITITAVYIDRKTDPILEFFEELWWIDVTFLVLFMISTIFYYVLILGLSNFKRWLVAIWMSVGLIEICLTVGKYARAPLEQLPRVQLHPSIKKLDLTRNAVKPF